jgi:hypothetical protein
LGTSGTSDLLIGQFNLLIYAVVLQPGKIFVSLFN